MKRVIMGTLTLGLTVTMGIGACASESGTSELAFVKSKNQIIIREKPNTDSRGVAVLNQNNAVYICGTADDGFVEVVSGIAHGYVKEKRLATGKKAKELADKLGREIAIVLPEDLNVREYADLEAEVFDAVHAGEELLVYSYDGDWVCIETEEGNLGYIAKSKCAFKKEYSYASLLVESNEAVKTEKEDNDLMVEKKEVEGTGEESIKADEAEETYAADTFSQESSLYSSDSQETYEENSYSQEATTADAYLQEEYPQASDQQETYTAETTWEETYAEQTSVAEAVSYEDDYQEFPVELMFAVESAESEESAYFETQQESESWQELEDYNVSGVFDGTSVSEEIQTSGAIDNSNGEKAAANALQYLGGKYVWGGTNPEDGVDCSGFTQYICREAGVEIPRVAADQEAIGKHVDLDDLQVGDLVFYNQEGNGVDHVGMYIGNDQIVHASNEEYGIIVSNINSSGTPYSAVSYLR